jgi:hypothetical protein
MYNGLSAGNQQELTALVGSSETIRGNHIITKLWYDIVQLSMKVLKLSTLIELIWTITPAIILILIAFPSFKLLYLMD